MTVFRETLDATMAAFDDFVGAVTATAQDADPRLLTLAGLAAALFLVPIAGGIHSAGASASGRRRLARLTRGPRWLGYATIAVLALAFAGWSWVAPLASASIALGVVSPDGSRKSVDHLEGGIVRAIHVREGDAVLAGDPLIVLDDVEARANRAGLAERRRYLAAAAARLSAERDRATEIAFPADLVADPASAEVVAAQQALFRDRRASVEGQRNILHRRIAQLAEQNLGLEAVIAAREEQAALIAEETATVQTLLDRGLEHASRILALRRAAAEIEVEIAGNRARIAENHEKIGETELSLLTLDAQVQERATGELADILRQLSEVDSRIPLLDDILSRTVVRAPISGVVMNVAPRSPQEVVKPGQTLLEIVPQDMPMIIDARIRPTDIDRIEPGMRARVVLTAYRQRNLPQIHGVLRSVSADRLIEDRTGEPYFLAKVEVDESDLERVAGLRLMPGMPAEVYILDGERTLVSYLVEPLVQSLDRSFREN